MSSNNNPHLTALVICKDKRRSIWVELLLGPFLEVYELQSSEDCRKFSLDDPAGLSILPDELPDAVDVIFFHSSPRDKKRWQQCKVEAKQVFEFNTPGTPAREEGVLPIYRQTHPYFAIKSKDIEQTVKFLIGQRGIPPSMCYPLPDVLPALMTLCQHYLAEGTDYSGAAVSQTVWWAKALGLLDHETLDWTACSQWLKTFQDEWQTVGQEGISGHATTALVDKILVGGVSAPALGQQPVVKQTVAEALAAIAKKLERDLSPAEGVDLLQDETVTKIKTVLSVQGSSAATAVATVLAELLEVEHQQLEPEIGKHRIKSLRKAVLVLAESQVGLLPRLRLLGFSGAVLVLSSVPFSELKKKYRVLRFGQGSHAAVAFPWTLTSLLQETQDLVPMEPENLRVLQNELKAGDRFYTQEVKPCLEQLRQGDDTDAATEKIAGIVAKVREKTPVACHAIATIEGKSCQIQEHFQAAMNKLREKVQWNQAVQQLEAAFEQWRSLVVSTAGEGLMLAYT